MPHNKHLTSGCPLLLGFAESKTWNPASGRASDGPAFGLEANTHEEFLAPVYANLTVALITRVVMVAVTFTSSAPAPDAGTISKLASVWPFVIVTA